MILKFQLNNSLSILLRKNNTLLNRVEWDLMELLLFTLDLMSIKASRFSLLILREILHLGVQLLKGKEKTQLIIIFRKNTNQILVESKLWDYWFSLFIQVKIKIHLKLVKWLLGLWRGIVKVKLKFSILMTKIKKILLSLINQEEIKNYYI